MLSTIKSIELPNGVRLPYIEGGNPAGHPVVLLHGYSDSLHSYDLLLPHLSTGVRAIAVTQRGHGDASRPETGYGLRDFSEDLAAFLDDLEISSAVIVGHSMGSLIAQRFALDHPERTSGLVLIGSFLRLQNLPDFAGFWGTIAGLDDPVDPDFVRGF